MRIEFFPEGSEECPLILIYGNDSSEAQGLYEAFVTLSAGATERIAVHELKGFCSVDDCHLFAIVGSRDIGVKEVGSYTFECILRPISWDQVAGLVEPLCAPRPAGTYFQYLDQTGKISLLISTNRSW